MPVEHEFKWLMSEEVISVLNNCVVHDIEQYYLPSGNNFVARIRKLDSLCFYTVKYKIDNQNIEIETEISENDYVRLKSITNYGIKKKSKGFIISSVIALTVIVIIWIVYSYLYSLTPY